MRRFVSRAITISREKLKPIRTPYPFDDFSENLNRLRRPTRLTISRRNSNHNDALPVRDDFSAELKLIRGVNRSRLL